MTFGFDSPVLGAPIALAGLSGIKVIKKVRLAGSHRGNIVTEVKAVNYFHV